MNEVIVARHRPFGAKSERFRELLLSYPDLEHRQVRDLVRIYARLTTLEMALLSADEAVADRFDAFFRDHCAGLACSWRRGLGVLLGLLAGFAMIAAAVWLVVN